MNIESTVIKNTLFIINHQIQHRIDFPLHLFKSTFVQVYNLIRKFLEIIDRTIRKSLICLIKAKNIDQRHKCRKQTITLMKQKCREKSPMLLHVTS